MTLRGGLFAKYVVLIAGLVTIALLASSAVAVYFFSKDYQAQLAALQREKALAAATRIELYIRDIEHQMGWTALPQIGGAAATLEARRLEYLKLLRQVPAITELTWLDRAGKEQLQVSRLAMDVMGAGTDHADQALFASVAPGKSYFSEVHFRQETEPYMTIARLACDSGGVTVAQVNLKFVWDVITQIKVGRRGLAFVVNSQGTLIAHPDISLVLQKKDFSRLMQVAALDSPASAPVDSEVAIGRDLAGNEVLTAHAPIASLGWNVFVELPLEEALEPLRDAVYRTSLLLLAGLALSVFASMYLARRMVRPIRALQAGADEIGAGRLAHRIDVHTGDELESVADRFNSMTQQLRESYEDLERKVNERTQDLRRTNAELNDALATLEQTREQLVVLVQERTAQQKIAESANTAKTRFLAAASHDLRQPITTIGLLGDLLQEKLRDPAIRPLVDQLREATRATESLLVGLMDVSRLDAGVERPDLQPVRLGDLFDSLRANAQPAADAKGLRLRLRAGLWAVTSDPVLLGRELRNLVDNAIRYTPAGGVLVAARPHGLSGVRIEVWDTGIGIEAHHLERVFEEFYQVGNAARDRRLGTGLGLAIVQRTAQLLGHTVRLKSVPGKGSCFSIVLPAAACTDRPPVAMAPIPEPLLGWSVWLVEDDAALHKALAARLEAWGAGVRSWPDAESLLAELDRWDAPDALLTDVRLPGMDGLQLAHEVARRLAPRDARLLNTILISGDTDPAQLTRIAASGLKMLAKPFHMEELLDAILRRGLAGASVKP